MLTMRTKMPVIALTTALFSLAGNMPANGAQSLADIARQEEARRKAIKQPSKVLTEEDLGSVSPISPPPPTLFAPVTDESTPAEADKSQAGKEPQAAGDKTGEDDTAEPPARDQAYWSGRARELQAQVSRNQTFATALQSRINALANDYTNEADPLRQAAIAADRQSALAELDRVTKQVEADQKALTDLQEEARRAGVPPGWLR
jgi:hypothetical protein